VDLSSHTIVCDEEWHQNRIIYANGHSALREDLAVAFGSKYIKTSYKCVSEISKDHSREITR
jgi:hypothetical protein